MVVSGSGITSWAITLTGGTAAHWTTPTDGTSPTPTAAGVAAALAGGPYTFNVTATNGDGTSNTVVLTINVVANTFSVSKRSEINAVTTGGDAQAAVINGKTVEFARGSTDLALAVYPSGNTGSTTGVVLFKNWRCSGANRCTIQHEDPDFPCDLGRITVQAGVNLDFVSLRINTALRFNLEGTVEFGWSLERTGTALGGNCTGIRLLDTFGSCGLDGVPGNPATVNGISFTAGTGLVSADLYNFEVYRCCKGIVWGVSGSSSTYQVTFHGRTPWRSERRVPPPSCTSTSCCLCRP